MIKKNNRINVDKPQWKIRVELVKYLYSILIKEMSQIEVTNELKKKKFTISQKKIITYFIKNKNEIDTKISENLNQNWSINRISLIDRCIFYEAISEFFVTKIDKKIIIDQSLITAKKFSPDGSVKYINAVLDKIL